MSSPANGPWVWIDLEMTGLEPETCTIIEIASIVTDTECNVIAEGPDLVIHQSDTELATMSPWCIEHHGTSGLSDACRASTLSIRDAEEQTLAFLRGHTNSGESALCGNSIGLDWRFIQAQMTELAGFLAHQLIDVTSVKELRKRWYPRAKKLSKAGGHRALADIQESIKELALYKRTIFR